MFTPARCTCTAYAAYHSAVRPVVDEQKTPLAAAKAMTRGAVPFNRACVKECALMCNSLDVISEDPAPSRGGEGEQGTQTLESQIATDLPCIGVAVSTQTKKEPVLVPLAREARSARWQQTHDTVESKSGEQILFNSAYINRHGTLAHLKIRDNDKLTSSKCVGSGSRSSEVGSRK